MKRKSEETISLRFRREPEDRERHDVLHLKKRCCTYYLNSQSTKPLDVLREPNVAPDFATDKADEMLYIHRTFDDADVYFVSHQGDSAKMVDCTFRTMGRVPEMWNPKTGAIQNAGLWQAQANGTRVTLPMEAGGSLFVVFRKPATLGRATFAALQSDIAMTRLPEITATNQGTQMLAWNNGRYTLTNSVGAIKRVKVQNVPQPIALSNPWTVNFTPNWGAPDQITLPQLQDWTRKADGGSPICIGRRRTNHFSLIWRSIRRTPNCSCRPARFLVRACNGWAKRGR